MDLVKYSQEIKKIRNVDVHHPAYPAYRKKVMDMADAINFIVVEILKKENRFNSD
jgi:cell fate (sporulation/competence/biofilm development) regulator YmcA (YheA/YmcA/DUF963 family)|tara:strand:- start:663 stop:827 length:165 start_codon:yes stop_codon:yes gene_type:complete